VGNLAASESYAAPPLLVRTPNSEHRLDGGPEYRIGRDHDADIVLTDARVSGRHAVLLAQGRIWVLEDRSSRNGTFLNAERTARVEIRGNCVVRLGHPEHGAVLRFEPQPLHGPGPADSLEYRPSVDRRPTTSLKLLAKALRIGRTPDNDLVVDDLSVSRRHAELRKSPSGRYRIVDLGSHNGTYVNGTRVERAELGEDDIIGIGHATFRLAGGELREYVDTGDVSLEARDLRVIVAGGKILLDDVSFPIPERCLLAVIGPSGAGKTTLLGALNGMRPADTGTVLYDNRDLYTDYAELRHRIGFVPQKDILHTQLTARAALGYAAELRFPSDTSKDERTKRIDEVLEALGLAEHADKRGDKLSGGQLKRVNVALELLTRPSLLLLDEPTSGLDPGLDAIVMEQLQELAHEGRTVIVVTHSVDNLLACDRLLVLVPGGRIAYYGPPGDGLKYFGKDRWADVFRAFHAEDGRDWARDFAISREYARHIRNPLALRPPQLAPEDRAQAENMTPPPPSRGRIRQTYTLARRYLRVIAADRLYLVALVAVPLILGALVQLAPDHSVLNRLSTAADPFHRLQTTGDAQTLLMLLTIMACLAGMLSSVWEVFKENGIFRRECAAGLSPGAYLLSKVLVLGVISVVQALVMTGIGLLFHAEPHAGALPWLSPELELIAAVAALEFASMCLGLLVSAWVNSSENAIWAVVVLTMVQVVCCGGLFPVAGIPVFAQFAWAVPARWGMGALASTVGLMNTTPDSLWNRTTGIWLLDFAMMLALGLAYLLIAWWRLSRLRPGRRR
jgi:ABC-type multidrug transport system ATPase subunit/pSer/pThr/pTyr-binding forkhead associated (FHA) protein